MLNIDGDSVMNGYDLTAATLKALAHPVRLQILEVLDQEEEACVCHLETRLNQRQAYISQQLAKLREAGLVEDRRDGLNVFYSLSVSESGPLLAAARNLAAAVGQAQGVVLSFDDIQRINPDDCLCPSCQEKLVVSAAQ